MGIFDDPESLSQLGMIGGLLGARKGDNWGNMLMVAASQMDQRKQRAMQEQMLKQQMEIHKQQLAQQQAQFGRQQGLLDLQKQFYQPGQPEIPQPAAEQGGGPGLPAQAPRMDTPGYTQAAMGRGLMTPMEADQLAKAERVTVAPGATVGSYRNGQFMPDFSAPDKAPPGYTRGPNGLVVDPNWLKTQEQLRAAGRPQITVDAKQENAFAAALGKHQGDTYSGLMNSDASAVSKITKLGRLESLLGKSGQTGALTPTTMQLKSVAESLGFKVDETLPFQQASEALSNEIALELRNPSGGAGMPGALSDSDRKYLSNMVPSIGKTPEGNKLLIDTARKLAQRDREIAKLARTYRSKTGRFDEGFYEELANYSANNPLFPDAVAPEVATGSAGWSVVRKK